MIRAILDYPLSLHGTCSTPSISQMLTDFSALIQGEELDAVRFLSPDEFQLWSASYLPQVKTGKQTILRMVLNLVRWEGSNCEATPLVGPSDFSSTWKCALRDAIPDPNDWRSPQIVVPSIRREKWMPFPSKIDIRLEICGDQEELNADERVLVELEGYRYHDHAKADSDPWDLRHVHRPQLGADPEKNPCMLPKPGGLSGVGMAEIAERSGSLRWKVGNCRYYLPPASWNPTTINKSEWRGGRAFPRGTKNGRTGWRDREGQIWYWDRTHLYGHWDVEMGDGTYDRVGYDGTLLD
jgi:hypothetical protein